MSVLTLKAPEQLTQAVESLVLSASDKFDLNRRMANRARQFFRAQIRTQRDIDNNPYQSRTKRKTLRTRSGKKSAHPNNKKMLVGFGRAMRTVVTDERFEVGVKGRVGKIGHEHNEGAQIAFTTRVNGFFDSKVGRWTGGAQSKRYYSMPKRTFIGWTPALEHELIVMAAEYFLQEDAP